MSDGIKPVIGDQFWFERSSEMVKGSMDRLDKWADRIKDLVTWAFPIYTATSILTVEYKKIEEWWIVLILAIPYLFLLYAYWNSQSVQKPISVTFDVRSPDEIKEAYLATYKEKSKKMDGLIYSSLFAIILLGVALITAFALKNSQKETSKEDIYLSGVTEKGDDKNIFIVSGKFPADSILRVQTSRRYYDTSQNKILIKDSSYLVLNMRNGILQQVLEIDTNTVAITYQIAWKENEYNKSLQREFKLKPVPKKSSSSSSSSSSNSSN